MVTLADIGALNSFGYDRRSALWQAERAVRPSGELFTTVNAAAFAPEALRRAAPELAEKYGELRREDAETAEFIKGLWEEPAGGPDTVRRTNERHPEQGFSADSAASPLDVVPPSEDCPLKPMTESERLVADYAGTGLTMGRHPMALKRETLAMQGVLRALDLQGVRQGRRIRVAGMVITRQRPGTAKGFVFLTLEDETGIANIIIRPDLFARERLLIVEEPFLLVDGILQNQDGVTSIRAEIIQRVQGIRVEFDGHDFY